MGSGAVVGHRGMGERFSGQRWASEEALEVSSDGLKRSPRGPRGWASSRMLLGACDCSVGALFMTWAKGPQAGPTDGTMYEFATGGDTSGAHDAR
eukprot:4977879-Pyramimonas_sp.AAC.2